jgi:hypothetical protein
MSLRFLTGIGLIVGAVSILVYDAIAFIYGGPNGLATISVVITDIANQSPHFSFVLVFLFGILTGHFFIPANGSGKDKL